VGPGAASPSLITIDAGHSVLFPPLFGYIRDLGMIRDGPRSLAVLAVCLSQQVCERQLTGTLQKDGVADAVFLMLMWR